MLSSLGSLISLILLSMMSNGKCCWGTLIAKVLVVVGAVNWGLVGIGGFVGTNLNVVNLLLGGWPQVEWVVYILVGLAGLMMAWECMAACKGGGKGECKDGGSCKC